MHTVRDTFYNPHPGTRQVAPTATQMSDAEGQNVRVTDGSQRNLLSPSPPPLSMADSRLAHIRKEASTTLTSFFVLKQILPNGVAIQFSLGEIFEVARLKPGLWIIKAFPYDRNLSAIPLRKSLRVDPAKEKNAKDIINCWIIYATNSSLIDAYQFLNGTFPDPQHVALGGLSEAIESENFKNAYRRCQEGPATKILIGDVVDQWDFRLESIDSEMTPTPLIHLFKQEVALLLDDIHLNVMNDLRRQVIEQVHTLGVANLPINDTLVESAFVLEQQANAILRIIIPGVQPTASELTPQDHRLQSLRHLYTSDITIWLFKRLLKNFGMERVVRAVNLGSQLSFSFACLSLPAALVEIELRTIENLHRQDGVRTSYAPTYNRLTADEANILHNHTILLDWVETHPQSIFHQDIAAIVHQLEVEQDLPRALRLVDSLPPALPTLTLGV